MITSSASDNDEKLNILIKDPKLHASADIAIVIVGEFSLVELLQFIFLAWHAHVLRKDISQQRQHH